MYPAGVTLRGLARSTAVALLALALPVPAAAQDDVAISAARRTSAKALDRALPAVPFEEWLRSLAGREARIDWEVNDCGEATGTPADAERDLPLCAEASVAVAGRGMVHVRVAVGTVRRGVLAGRGLYGIWAEPSGGRVESFTRLRYLARWLRTGKR